MKKTKTPLLEAFRKMRLPNLGATRRVGNQALARVKFGLPIGFGGGDYYILEFDHQNTAYAIYVDAEGEIRNAQFVTIEEFSDEPSSAVFIDGNIAVIDEEYRPETLPKLRERLAQEWSKAAAKKESLI